MGDGGGGHWLVRMGWRPAGWSVCLPLIIFPYTIKSRCSLLAPAHPGGPGKRAVKHLCVRVCVVKASLSPKSSLLEDWESQSGTFNSRKNRTKQKKPSIIFNTKTWNVHHASQSLKTSRHHFRERQRFLVHEVLTASTWTTVTAIFHVNLGQPVNLLIL